MTTTAAPLVFRPSDLDYANALIDVAHTLIDEGRAAEAEVKLALAEAILDRVEKD